MQILKINVTKRFNSNGKAFFLHFFFLSRLNLRMSNGRKLTQLFFIYLRQTSTNSVKCDSSHTQTDDNKRTMGVYNSLFFHSVVLFITHRISENFR